MGQMSRFIQEHVEGCTDCADIDARTDLTDMDKFYAQEEHALNSAITMAEAYKESLKY